MTGIQDYTKEKPSWEEVERILNFEEYSPTSVLAPRELGDRIQIRAFNPIAEIAWVEDKNGSIVQELEQLERSGFFFRAIERRRIAEGYLLCFRDSSGYVHRSENPYAFAPEISDYDLYLLGKGELEKSYLTLGAHERVRAGVSGVRFAVWAPAARAVGVVGDFNHWTVGASPMEVRGNSGVWELFIPRVTEGEVYKFAIKSPSGVVKLKTDPYAFGSELRPRTASKVVNIARHKWNDSEWLRARESFKPFESPISIYEVHLGSWKKSKETTGGYLSFTEIADELIPYVTRLGFTHIELLPVMEHPLDQSWGYQVTNYYSVTSRYGGANEFMEFVERCHAAGIGVILDWPPGHFPKDEHGLAFYNGTPLYEPGDPEQREHPDWGTHTFDFSRYEVRNFLVSNALFWLDMFHVDGIRVDAVSSMLYLDYSRRPGTWKPNRFGGRENLEAIAFLRQLNSAVHTNYPGAITVAEESTSWTGVTSPIHAGGLGFDFKWMMGWMHDTLSYFSRDPIYRKYHQNEITFSIWYAFAEKFILPISHDEVTHGKGSMFNKMPGDEWQKFANLRLCYTYMWAHPGKKLLFMGNEFGTFKEWNETEELDWSRLWGTQAAGLSRLVADLNQLMKQRDSLHLGDHLSNCFEWIDSSDSDQSVMSFVRFSPNRTNPVIFVFNMTPVPRSNYKLGVPAPGFYRELLNSDAKEYGGSGVGNLGGVTSRPEPMHGRPYSVVLTLPPLGALALEPVENN